jgi:hypothetical protein
MAATRIFFTIFIESASQRILKESVKKNVWE